MMGSVRAAVPAPPPPRVKAREAVGPADAATLMDVSESTIYRLIRSGRLKATRIGAQWRILIIDLRRGSSQP